MHSLVKLKEAICSFRRLLTSRSGRQRYPERLDGAAPNSMIVERVVVVEHAGALAVAAADVSHPPKADMAKHRWPRLTSC